MATVTPLLKKPSLDSENMKNYRPVSNLAYVGKLVEKVVVSQIDAHMTVNNLHEPLQSAYRANHSVETALLRVSNDLLLAIDGKKCVFLTLLDLSAAFDTIDHSVFLTRIDHENGISESALKWLKSYFTDRSQEVHIQGQSSSKVALETGFPQGSVVGPFGFKPYTKPLTQIAKKYGVSIHLYADDTQLYIAFDPLDHENALSTLESCIADIREWMRQNCLKLNDTKTEFMVMGSKHQLSLVKNVSLKIGTEDIQSVPKARNIGAVFDASLEMKDQVNQVTKSCYAQLRSIAQIRKHLTQEATAKLVNSFVTSRLDNLNSLLFGVHGYLIEKLQLIQNSSARLITRVKSSDHITPALISLHWLPVKYRIEYKILLLTYKAQHGKAPAYLKDLLIPYNPKRCLRSCARHELEPQKSRLKRFGDRTFTCCAPHLWNNLPFDVKLCQSTEQFKKSLKTLLFKRAFQGYL